MLVVVSDAYVKWRGGYQPSSAEEVQVTNAMHDTFVPQVL